MLVKVSCIRQRTSVTDILGGDLTYLELPSLETAAYINWGIDFPLLFWGLESI